jgi:uncharacterized protein (TIGR00369 family)
MTIHPADLASAGFFSEIDITAVTGYSRSMKEIVRYRRCFVCGDENQHGLKAKFFEHEGGAITEVLAEPGFEGYHGLYHGGVLASLLDEVMIKAVLARGVFAVTAEMTIRYKKPVPIGARIRLTGKIVGRRGRVFDTEGEATGADGVVFATASGRYLEAGTELKSQLTQALDP